MRLSLLRTRALGGDHPEYAPVDGGTTWKTSGIGGYNAFIRSSTEIPYEALQVGDSRAITNVFLADQRT